MIRDLIPFTQRRAGAYPVDAFHREVDRLFDDFWRGFDAPAPFAGGRSFGAKLDVTEDAEAIHISADLPGIDEKDVEVTLKDGVLTIRGEKKAENEKKDKHIHVMERSYGSFQRAIAVGDAVDEEKVAATFKNGVLNIVLPKSAKKEESTKRIEIKSA